MEHRKTPIPFLLRIDEGLLQLVRGALKVDSDIDEVLV